MINKKDLLFTEPVVFFFSLWVAFSWAILYLNFSSIPLVFSTNHGFNVQQIGAVFSGEWPCFIYVLSITDSSQRCPLVLFWPPF